MAIGKNFSRVLRFERILKTWLVWVLGVACPWALAQDYGQLSAHMRVHKIHISQEINPDYTSVRDYLIEREALSADGAVHAGKYSISFNPDLESVEILEAATQKADGQVLKVNPKSIEKQSGIVAPGTGVSWPGVQTWQVVFPQVLSGDRTVLRYRLSIHKPTLEKWLGFYDYLSNDLSVLDYQATLKAPAAMRVQVAGERLNIKTEATEDWQTWRIQGSSRGFASEPQMANGLKVLPYWMYATLPSREALSDAFAHALRSKLSLTPQVQALAQEITQGKATPFEKAQAIHQWITQNIRYVAVFVGTGGYVPNELASILEKRYGDCKDMALLTIALLQASGIEAAPALINTAHTNWAPPVAAPIYNHVIVFIPSLDLFTDPTANAIPFGKLPWADSAKPVLIGYAGASKESRTPAFSAQGNSILINSHWTFDRQGDAQVKLSITTLGQAATEMQDQLSQIPTGMGFAAIQRFLKPAGLKGKGTLNFPPVQRQTQTQSLRSQLHLEGVLSSPEVGSLNPHPPISSLPVYVTNLLGVDWQEGRKLDAECTPMRVQEVFSVDWPEGMQVLHLPKGLSVDQAGLQYKSEYSLTATGWKGSRIFERAPTASGHICNLDEIAARRPVATAIRKDLRDVAMFKAP